MARAFSRRQYLKQLEALRGKVSRQFLDAVRAKLADVSLNDVISGVVANDVEAIARAAGVSAADMTTVLETLRSGYMTGAAGEAVALGVGFDITLPAVQSQLALASSELVVAIGQGQREGIRAVLAAGYEAGRNPRLVALDIVGRVAASGRREGGIIGLDPNMVKATIRARVELATGDPAYFRRKRRDRRYDAAVRKSMRTGEPLPDGLIDKIVGRYNDRLLQLRGENIARTETLTAMASGRHNALAQGVERGDIDPRDVVRIWSATMDRRTRHAHASMDGQKRAWGEPFVDEDGNQMMFPGDTSLGAAPDSTINCRCFARTKIDFIAAQKRREAEHADV